MDGAADCVRQAEEDGRWHERAELKQDRAFGQHGAVLKRLEEDDQGSGLELLVFGRFHLPVFGGERLLELGEGESGGNNFAVQVADDQRRSLALAAGGQQAHRHSQSHDAQQPLH